MFLNEGKQLRLLRHMKAHTLEMFDAIQRCNFERMGRLIRDTWAQNMALDSGTNPPAVEAITRRIDDLCLGYKLPGAGGGGYLYMVAKDPEAAARIRQTLNADPLRPQRPLRRHVALALRSDRDPQLTTAISPPRYSASARLVSRQICQPASPRRIISRLFKKLFKTLLNRRSGI